MVFTRGKQSVAASNQTASAVTHVIDATEPEINHPRLRKRRRSASPPAEQKSPTAKRQNLSSSTPATAQNGKRGVSPRNTRNRPTADAVQPSEPQRSISPAFVNTNIKAQTSNSIHDPPAMESSHIDGQRSFVSDRGNSGVVNDSYSSQVYQGMDEFATASLLPRGASLHMKMQSLPVLDNLATQILNILAKSSYQEIINMATKPESEAGKAYATLKTLFNHAKKVYSQNEPFLSIEQLGLANSIHVDTIRKSNTATFATTVFGSQEVGFYHLNEHFLDTFVVYGHQILKTQAQLFLDLKTQAYISAAATGQRSREDILDDLFPLDLETRLLHRRPGARQLAPSEKDFLQRARNRKKALLEEPNTEEAIASLPEKYVWENFLKDARKTSRSQRVSHLSTKDPRQQLHESLLKIPSSAPQQLLESAQIDQGDDIAGKAQRAAQYAIEGYGNSKRAAESPNMTINTPQQKSSIDEASSQPGPSPQPELQFHFENQLHPNVPGPQLPYFFQNAPYQNSQMPHQWQPESTNEYSYIPYPTQSAPTKVLYERARMAASSKLSPSTRRTGHPSQRRPWTIEEENWLMAGLDRVKGPHWSQILAMFGPGGTVNEVLKDRNQVQLKDKARNLKLFFLKSNMEVPYYLQFVTGELKTRAPAQAAKNEAKGKKLSEEDRAHVEGVMALASGPQLGGENAGQSNEADGLPSENLNVDPNLDGMRHGGALQTRKALPAEYGAPTTRGVAPSADMLTGRQGQYQESSNHMPYTQYDDANIQAQANGVVVGSSNASGLGRG
ncbi:MAG: hypothetical protein Q9163_004895 [Psora crenata]